VSSKEIYNDGQVSSIIALLENSTWDYPINISLYFYVLAANIPVFGFLGTGIDFLGAMLDVFPPRPAHFMIGQGLADCDRCEDPVFLNEE
jgi:hypothetical protein